MTLVPFPASFRPAADRVSDSLDLSRHWGERQDFFTSDPAAKYLSEQLAAGPPKPGKAPRGSFSWVIAELALDDVSAFAMGLGLASGFDGSWRRNRGVS